MRKVDVKGDERTARRANALVDDAMVDGSCLCVMKRFYLMEWRRCEVECLRLFRRRKKKTVKSLYRIYPSEVLAR